ncbi:MAG: sugar phosphate isomerase/epimerase [Clostridia bacterium]|nr:sugar phosphate isomerase/epimerase [Clostridia bacterium]MBQ9919851.1 sugar phosphate isomerase/epimerase [Clostridia bacterium]
MSIGISTASFYPLETEDAIALISENRIECTEIFFNSNRELKHSFIDYLLDIIKNSPLKVTAIHPMLSFAEPYMIFSDYIRRFEESEDVFKRYFEIAARLGAKYVNLHGDKPTGKLPVEEYCERFKILSDIGKGFGVTLCQENVNGYRSADPEFLSDMVRLLGDDANFTLDIKQVIRAGYTLPEILEAMDYKIRHVHISDHSPAADCLLPTRGTFNFNQLFCDLKNHGYNGDYVIEVYQNAYNDYSEIFESYLNLKKSLK